MLNSPSNVLMSARCIQNIDYFNKCLTDCMIYHINI